MGGPSLKALILYMLDLSPWSWVNLTLCIHWQALGQMGEWLQGSSLRPRTKLLERSRPISQGTLLCIHLINMNITFTIFGKLECVTCLKRWTSLEIYWFVKWFVLYLLGPFNLWSGTPADQCLWAKPLWICIWLYHTLCL